MLSFLAPVGGWGMARQGYRWQSKAAQAQAQANPRSLVQKLVKRTARPEKTREKECIAGRYPDLMSWPEENTGL
jgi:hypothetical protein